MLDLTNYEMLDLASSHIANASDDLNRLAAAVTAYLLVAYRAGKDLTRFQVLVVNVFFTVIALQAGMGAMGENAAAVRFWRSAIGTDIGSMNILYNQIGMILGLGGLVACLAFMWRIRHPKSE